MVASNEQDIEKKPARNSVARRGLTDEEWYEWDRVYRYVRTNCMDYNDNQSLSRTMYLRLRGMQYSKIILDTDIESDISNYTPDVILNTFKYCYPEIQRSKSKTFKNDMHRFMYITKIVEDKLNTVYKKMKSAQSAEEKTEKYDVSDVVNYSATFKKKKPKTKNTSKFDDLW